MTLQLLFWILMLLVLVFGLWTNWPLKDRWRPAGNLLLIFMLFLILGWAVFGAPVQR